MRRVAIQTEDFSAQRELALLAEASVGGIGSFIGIVRAGPDAPGRVKAMTLEHYPGMTEKALEKIADEAEARFELTGVTLIHRVGRLLAGENIVFVGAASPHRQAVLQATAFLIDWLKTEAPFWKVEELESGERHWVEAKAEDTAKAEGWKG